jgi:hypothetical protein
VAQGAISYWDGRHGLIRPTDGPGRELYFGSNDVPRDMRPAVGDRVAYEVKVPPAFRGRLHATQIRLVVPRSGRCGSKGLSSWTTAPKRG